MIGWGTTFTLTLDQLARLPKHLPLAHVPILILGAGASGLLVVRALQDLGFRKLTVLDRAGIYGGIWNWPALQMARANPFTLRYRSPQVHASVPRGPGSGRTMAAFFRHLAIGEDTESPLLPDVQQAEVLGVAPGDLWHSVAVREGDQARILHSPILINCLGVGEPLPLSASCVMQTDAASEQLVDTRWQEPLTPHDLECLAGQRLLFVSMSNSTLTMLQQVQRAIDEGHDLSYTVLTHHPIEHLLSPRTSGLYRDVHAGLLTELAGDLPPVHEALLRACTSPGGREQVLCRVARWSIWQEHNGKRHVWVDMQQERSLELTNIGRVYALVGYGHTVLDLGRMGLRVAEGRVLLDSDGEVQAATEGEGPSRLHRGYFALGPVAQGQPNGAVLPGIFYRVGEMLPSIICRAAEYSIRP